VCTIQRDMKMVGVRYLRIVVTKLVCHGGGVDSCLGMDLFLLKNIQIGSGAHPASCSMCTGDKAKREVKNEWSHTSSPLYAFISSTETT
jgi:hypothetical protein